MASLVPERAGHIHADRRARALERHARFEAIQEGVRPIAAAINDLAGKVGVAPSTIAKHALLIPVPLPGQPDWNARVGEWVA